MKGNLAAGLIVVLLLAGGALSACGYSAIDIGSVKSASAIWLETGRDAQRQRDLTPEEQTAIIGKLKSCRLVEPKGDLVTPFGCIRIETAGKPDGSGSPAIYTLYVYEEYMSWMFVIDKDGVEKDWVLDKSEGLGEIVKGIMKSGDWQATK